MIECCYSLCLVDESATDSDMHVCRQVAATETRLLCDSRATRNTYSPTALLTVYLTSLTLVKTLLTKVMTSLTVVMTSLTLVKTLLTNVMTSLTVVMTSLTVVMPLLGVLY